jgi:hypothetical protein
MSEDFEVLSAVMDGDVVDIGELEMALENPRGRRVFVDFVRLRQTAADDAAVPRREFSEGVVRDLTLGRPGRKRGVPYPLAAAAILVAVLLGALLSPNSATQNSAPTGPPEPTRVLRFEPGVDWQP